MLTDTWIGDLSRESVWNLVHTFEDCSLPREEWTHEAHLMVGLWYVLHHGEQRALDLMSRGIRRYNQASGRTEAERNGFDAEVTRQWIARIADFARRRAPSSPEGTIFRRIASGSLARSETAPAEDHGEATAERTMHGTESSEEADVTTQREQITQLLSAGARGEDVVRQLFGLVYDELCAIAGRRMQSERSGHTLQATALVHEAYARLIKDQHMAWSSRRHFFGAAAQAMRRILVDHARYVNAQRRGSGKPHMSLTAANVSDSSDPDRMLAIDDALTRLEEEDERAASVVRLRYFAGLSLEETAEALEVSVRTVKREWTFARARLHALLK